MFFFVILLALIQGLTEFLPVSSSGHLALIENLPWFSEQSSALSSQISLLAFNVILHVGTLLSVLYFYRKDIIEITGGFFRDIKNKNYQGDAVKWVLRIGLATIPAATVPFYKDYVEQAVHSLKALALLFAINAVILIIADIARKFQKSQPHDEVSLSRSLFIGIWQCVAVFPGISRSGATISAAIVTGVNSYQAVRFSFLISIPIMLAATLLEIKHLLKADSASTLSVMPLLGGFLIAFLCGLMALRILVWFSRKLVFYPFAIYTFSLAALILFLLS